MTKQEVSGNFVDLAKAGREYVSIGIRGREEWAISDEDAFFLQRIYAPHHVWFEKNRSEAWIQWEDSGRCECLGRSSERVGILRANGYK